jgi:hypothetical protein
MAIIEDGNIFNRRADIKVYNSDNIAVSENVIDREYVIIITVNASFYALYTNAG